MISRTPSALFRAALVGIAAALLAPTASTAQDDVQLPTTTVTVRPGDNATGVRLDRGTALRFSRPIDPATVSAASVVVSSGGRVIPTSFRFSLNRKVVTVGYPTFLPALSVIEVRVIGDSIIDVFGLPVDGDKDREPGGVLTASFETRDATLPPSSSGSAVILGRVFEKDANGSLRPLENAIIRGFDWPRDGTKPHAVPPAFSAADGTFQYTTIPFAGQGDFVIEITKGDSSVNPPIEYSESLRRVRPLAGGCVRIENVELQRLAPKVPVTAAQGGTLVDPTGTVSIIIPAGALMRDSDIGLTVLDTSEALRQDLPPLVAREGCFVDVSGVFGEQTTAPVTLCVPNTYNLPPGTRVPFGKVDHNTLEWSDLRDLYTGPGQPPDRYLGTVSADGSIIEVEFDHFCSICTGYCLPEPCPEPDDPDDDDDDDDDPCDNGESGGNSTIGLREGYLRETIALPAFREHEASFSLSLGYFSGGANPSVTLQSPVDYDSTRPVERTIFSFSIEGRSIEGIYGFTQNNQQPIGRLFWDGVDGLGQRLATGSYPFVFQVTSLNAATAVSVPASFGSASIQSFGATYPGLTVLKSNVLEGRVTLINLVDSEYGAGWRIMEEPRLHFDADSTVVLVHGNSRWVRYAPDPTTPNLWVTDVSDETTMVFNPATGGFRRTFPDGEEHWFGADGRILRKVDRYGSTIRFVHSGGLLRRVVSRTGFVYRLSYDAAGKLRSITDSADRTTALVVDAAGDLVAVTDATAATRTFSYDAGHALTSQTGARGERSEYDYSNGRVTESRAFDTDGTTLLRRRGFAPSVIDGEILAAIAQGFGSLDLPIPVVSSRQDVVTDGRGFDTVHEVDSDLQTALVRDPLGNEIRFSYHPDGRLAVLERANGWSSEFDYDVRGNLIEAREYGGNALYSTRTVEYAGPFGQLSRIVDEEGKQTVQFYDALGSLTVSRDHDGNETRYFYGDPRFPGLFTRIDHPNGQRQIIVYDEHGNAVRIRYFPDPVNRPGGSSIQLTRDDAGNATVLTDPLGHSQTFSFDAFNRTRSVRDHLGNLTSFDYGGAGCGCTTPNLTRVTFPNLTSIRYDYDGLDRLVTRTDQMGRTTSFSYDAEGNRLTSVNRNGELVEFEYDAAGNLITKRPQGSETVRYQYDVLGNVTAVADPICTLQYDRDFLGRIGRVTTILDLSVGTGQPQGLAHALDYTYDRVHNRVTLRDSLGIGNFDYVHDNQHRLSRVTLANDPARSWLNNYDEAGLLLGRVPSPAGAITTYARDLAGQIEQLSVQSSPPLAIDYTLDSAGKAATAQEAVVQAATNGYSYDDADRLTRVVSTVSFGDATANPVHVYDPDNRLRSDGEYDYTYDAEGRLIRRVRIGSTLTDEYGYDAEGRMRSHTQTIDDQGQPTTLLTVTYVYDPFGRRIERNVNGVITRFVYDGDNILHELDAFNRVDKTYVHGAGVDTPIALLDAIDERVLHYHAGRIDTVVALSDDAGDVVQGYSYDEFGNPVDVGDSSLRQAFTYTGRQLDPETGLYFYRARHYDSRIGRFTGEDPEDVFGGLNLYAYVLNDPINANDPFGRAPGLACVNTCRLKFKTPKALGEPNACCELEKCIEDCDAKVRCIPYDCAYTSGLLGAAWCLGKTAWRCF